MNLWCSVQPLRGEALVWNYPLCDPVVELLWCRLWSSDTANGNIYAQSDSTSTGVWLVPMLRVYKRWQSSSALIYCLFAGFLTLQCMKGVHHRAICLLFRQLRPKSSEVFPSHVSCGKGFIFFDFTYLHNTRNHPRIYHPGDGFTGPALFRYESQLITSGLFRTSPSIVGVMWTPVNLQCKCA